MISLPPVQRLADTVARLEGARVAVWCTPSVAERLRALVPWTVHTEAPSLDGVEWLLVVGGGTLIDRAKILRVQAPHVRLAALPTIWGSGAEASPIAVLTVNGTKVIRKAPELVPDLIVRHVAFAQSLPAALVRHACGDAWSHALEGFLSPLGTTETRAELGPVMTQMLQQPIGYSDAWFDLSALACVGQSQTSVGLVHGIAHTLEGRLGWGHAKLCSVFLLPVMRFTRTHSPKWPFLAEHGLADGPVFSILLHLFDPTAYTEALPSLRDAWMTVLRDPCTRTHSALVRPGDLAFFEAFTA